MGVQEGQGPPVAGGEHPSYGDQLDECEDEVAGMQRRWGDAPGPGQTVKAWACLPSTVGPARQERPLQVTPACDHCGRRIRG